MDWQEAVLVGDSEIGLGVFAKLLLGPDDRVSEIAGHSISEEDYSSDYCIDLGHGRVMEPHEPFRFLNHSCSPNCELYVCEDEEGNFVEVALYATAAVQPGDELTIDYAWAAEHAIPCGCGEDTCRGWVVSQEELPDLLESRASQPIVPQMTPDQPLEPSSRGRHVSATTAGEDVAAAS